MGDKPAAGAARPLDAAAESQEPTDDKRRRFSNTPRATHNKLIAARVVWPAAGGGGGGGRGRRSGLTLLLWRGGIVKNHWMISAAASPTRRGRPTKSWLRLGRSGLRRGGGGRLSPAPWGGGGEHKHTYGKVVC